MLIQYAGFLFDGLDWDLTIGDQVAALVMEHDGTAIIRSPIQVYPVRDGRVVVPSIAHVPNESFH